MRGDLGTWGLGDLGTNYLPISLLLPSPFQLMIALDS